LQGVGHVEVPRVERRVLGLADHATCGVEGVEPLRELGEPAEVGHRGVAADVTLADERRAVHGAEDHLVVPDVDTACGVARLHVERSGRLGHLFEDEVRIEPHALLVDLLPGLPEELQRTVGQELHPDLRHDPLPAPIKDVHGVLGKDLIAGHGVAEHGAPGDERELRSLTAALTGRILTIFLGTEVPYGGTLSGPARNGPVMPTAHVGSQAVDRASALLTLVVESGAPRTFTSLVEELGLAKSTTSRLLQALERSRLLQRDQSGAFRPGALFSLYAARPSALHDLVELARPTLERIGDLSEETVNLAVPRGSELVHIAQIDSKYVLGATNWVGVNVPAHCTALGKVLFAFGALPLPRGNLERRTPHSPVDRAQLEHSLVEVRRRGWAVSLDELEVGLGAVAAPVRAVDGAVVAAISVSGPTTRINDHGITKLGDLLVAETRGLSAQLGHVPGKDGE
jgi:DNA-binding IclR family transcriptional regulator